MELHAEYVTGALEENARTMGKRRSMEAGVLGLTLTLIAQEHAAGVFNTKRELAQILPRRMEEIHAKDQIQDTGEFVTQRHAQQELHRLETSSARWLGEDLCITTTAVFAICIVELDFH